MTSLKLKGQDRSLSTDATKVNTMHLLDESCGLLSISLKCPRPSKIVTSSGAPSTEAFKATDSRIVSNVTL